MKTTVDDVERYAEQLSTSADAAAFGASLSSLLFDGIVSIRAINIIIIRATQMNPDLAENYVRTVMADLATEEAPRVG
jgi:hypothetical protein